MSNDQLSMVFHALSDPTRRAILQSLAEGQKTVQEISGPFHLTGPAISKHLKVLENAGLVSAMVNAQTRPRKLEAERLKSAQEYLEQYRQFWDASFDRLDKYLMQLQSQPNNENPKEK